MRKGGKKMGIRIFGLSAICVLVLASILMLQAIPVAVLAQPPLPPIPPVNETNETIPPIPIPTPPSDQTTPTPTPTNVTITPIPSPTPAPTPTSAPGFEALTLIAAIAVITMFVLLKKSKGDRKWK